MNNVFSQLFISTVAFTWETMDLFREVRTLELFSILAKASLGVRLKRLPPAALFKES
jgi:hypothetical protein